jgi:hypothetical protein
LPFTREININPIGVFGLVPEICGIPYHLPIYRIFERIGKFRTVEHLICMWWEINSEITAGPGRIVAVAGGKDND